MDELDRRRTFRRKEVRRGWERQGRVCALVARTIPFDLMHGDHIFPWSQGGRTSLDNCQALCGSCNLRKGSRPQEVVEQHFETNELAAGEGDLRKWQQEALSRILPHILIEPVLVEACPGAGKTYFGLKVAYRLFVEDTISRILVKDHISACSRLRGRPSKKPRQVHSA
jgi:hypothetical protein